MKAKFIGAIERVTGSCTLLEHSEAGLRFLVDCGMAQGDPRALASNLAPWPFLASRIDFVLLTHAHLDHCGLLPRLVREGFTGQIYCTRFTAELARLNLISASTMSGAPFTRMDVELLQFTHVDELNGFGWGKPFAITKGLFASFQPTAHIGGACSVTIRWRNGEDSWKEMAFSGDLGPNNDEVANQSLLAGRAYLSGAPQYLLVESTYGGRVREPQFADANNRLKEWKRIIRSAVETVKATIVVPCFSIHRCQELLFDIHVVLERNLREEIVSVRPWLTEDAHIENALQLGLRGNKIDRPINAMHEWPKNRRDHFNEIFLRCEEIDDSGKLHTVYRPIADDNVTLEQARSLVREMRVFTPKVRIQVILDSPLGQRVTSVFRRELKRCMPGSPGVPMYRNCALKELLGLDSQVQVDALTDRLFLGERESESKFASYILRFCKPEETEDVMKDGDVNIVLSSSGMCDVGPVVPHLIRELPISTSTIVLTGYADPETVGGRLRAVSRSSGNAVSEQLNFGDATFETSNIRAKVEDLGGYYSGHADSDGLVDFVFRRISRHTIPQSACRVFINHGDERMRQALAQSIEQRIGFRADTDCSIAGIEVPTRASAWFDLDLDKWISDEPISEMDELRSMLLRLFLEQRRTNDLLAETLKLQRPPRPGQRG
ncbi:MBL fold metallo-hydrolase [Propionivibrio dicarboxylicus]|uniref:Beta-Casp domain-containing protein n=1 Tax=Propionivibrio dicarboxylicus TaxID=83767 RepID=A0A1G7Z8S5_9RHOO|nr:MBL fold metallo-hydrolase [Propionivibrio dicarboxylicus]SDH05009.1 Beta-Casp domain-containing protein [Propionivibrio dicarboxylicus]